MEARKTERRSRSHGFFAIKDAGFCRRFSLQPIPIVNLWDCFVRNSVNACHIVSLCSAAFFFSSETGSIHFLQSLQAMGMLGKKRNDPTRFQRVIWNMELCQSRALNNLSSNFCSKIWRCDSSGNSWGAIVGNCVGIPQFFLNIFLNKIHPAVLSSEQKELRLNWKTIDCSHAVHRS